MTNPPPTRADAITGDRDEADRAPACSGGPAPSPVPKGPISYRHEELADGTEYRVATLALDGAEIELVSLFSSERRGRR